MSKKISELYADNPATLPLTGNELLEITQGGVSKGVEVSDLPGTDLSALTVLPDPRWDVVQDNAGDTYKRTSASVFYAVDYGVVADGVTDDWAAIQAALAACNAAGGGDVILPIGIMMVSDSIKFPLNAFGSPTTCKSIRLIGQSVPNMKSDPLTSTPHPQTGSIIEGSFLDTKGVIDSESSSGTWGDYNFMNITIENISVRVRSKTAGVDVAAIGKGIDCTRMANVQLKNISVSITSNIFNSVQPASTAIGILYPPVNNFVMIYSDTIFITGFYYACMLFEHATIDNYFADACYYGIFFNAGNHSSHVNKACIARCKITVGTGGGARFGLDNLSIEDKLAGGLWWSNTLDLEQHPDSAGYINYQRVETDIGGPDNDEFRRTNGPYNVICLPLGENMPKWATSNRPTILPEAATIIGYNTTLSYAEVYDHTTASWIPINGVPEEPSYCDHDLGLSLKGYWDFEEDSGNFLDKSGNTKDLLRVNGTPTVIGKIVDGGGFTGSSSQYVRTNVGTGLSAGTGFTFAGWVMLDSTADTYMVIAQKGNTSTFNFEYNIFQFAGNVYWQMSTDGLGSGIVSVNRPLLRDSLWHFITGTWDGANISLQVDNGTAATAAMATAYTNNSTFLYLGSDPTPTNYITGRLDEIGIWDTALSGGELTALYNSGTGRTIGTAGGGILFAGSDCSIDHDLQFHWDNTNKNLGIGTNVPNTAAILDLTSTTMGLLLPRMTKTQRDAISSPLAGLAIYQTDNTPGLRVYNGTNWMKYTESTD